MTFKKYVHTHTRTHRDTLTHGRKTVAHTFISNKEIAEIDMLVGQGIVESRSGFIRAAIKAYLFKVRAYHDLAIPL